MDLTKKRWIILAASCILNLCAGSVYAWSVFAKPMAKHLAEINGGAAPDLAIVFTMVLALWPVTMIAGGIINDKYGPRWVLFAGGLLFGAGMMGSAFATSVPMLILTYSVGLGFGQGFVYGTVVATAVKFFPDRRGLAGGLATASYGGSSMLVGPIATQLIASTHVTTTFLILGVVMTALLLPLSFFIQKAPVDFVPTGWDPQKATAKASVRDYNVTQMVKNPVFYLLFFIMVFGTFSGLMVISKASPIAQEMIGLSPMAAAITVSILALANTSGRIITGWTSDKIGIANTLSITLTGSVIALLLLSQCGTGTVAMFYAGVVLLGFGFGSVMAIFPGFTAFEFGSRNNTVNYGVVYIAFGVAGVGGPMTMATILATTGTYQPAFYVAASCAALSLATVRIYAAFFSPQAVAKKTARVGVVPPTLAT